MHLDGLKVRLELEAILALIFGACFILEISVGNSELVAQIGILLCMLLYGLIRDLRRSRLEH